MLHKVLARIKAAMAWASQHEKVVLACLFLLALSIRFLYAGILIDLDKYPSYDAGRYNYFAMRILEGEGYRTGFGLTASKPPLYPSFIAGIYFLFGPGSFAALRLLQASLDSITCVLLYLVGTSLAGRTVGLLAATGAVLYPLSIYLSAILYPEALFLLLLTATLLLVIKMVQGGRTWLALAGGGLFGLCVLARSDIVLFLPFLLLYPFLLGKRRAAWRLALASLAAFLAVMLPWSLRNYGVFHEFVPLTSEAGGVFWAGNNPLAAGGGVIPSQETWPDDDYPDRKWSGWSDLSEPESSRKFFRAGLSWIRTHPLDFVALIPQKLAGLWSPASFTTHSDRSAGPLAPLLWLLYAPFLLLAMAGMVISLRRWRNWFLMYGLLLVTNLVAALFHGGTRYSVPMVPALLTFAALGLQIVCSRVFHRGSSDP